MIENLIEVRKERMAIEGRRRILCHRFEIAKIMRQRIR